MIRPLAFLATCGLALAHAPAAEAQQKLRTYELKYHTLHTDLDKHTVAEAAARITSMAEEYYDRTRGFAGQITRRLPFYLYGSAEDYYAAGGMKGTGGVFDGRKLMAIGDPRLGDERWRIIQHEGFHQFAVAVIGGDLPIWVNEGLAEYFGESIFTGDGYVTGVVPPQRLARLKRWIDEGNTLSIQAMMKLRHETWNVRLSLVDYDQAWSMVYFLGHAREGKYQKPFNGFISDVSHGAPWETAWQRNFGTGVREFEKQWRAYWSALPRDATKELYARACAATLTSFYARAASQRQFFDTADAFFEAAEAGTLRSHADDWLPPSLLTSAMASRGTFGDWAVFRQGTRNELQCTTPEGASLSGQFQVTSGGRVKAGSVKVVTKKPAGKR